MLQRTRYDCYAGLNASLCIAIGHVHNIPIVQLPKMLNQKRIMLSFTENSCNLKLCTICDVLMSCACPQAEMLAH